VLDCNYPLKYVITLIGETQITMPFFNVVPLACLHYLPFLLKVNVTKLKEVFKEQKVHQWWPF